MATPAAAPSPSDTNTSKAELSSAAVTAAGHITPLPTPLPLPTSLPPPTDLVSALSSLTLSSTPPSSFSPSTVRYVTYSTEHQLPYIQSLIDKDLSEPYSIFTYRYFLNNWPDLCFLAMIPNPHPPPPDPSPPLLPYPAELCIGTIISKLSTHYSRASHTPPNPPLTRGYIAMLATSLPYRHRGVAAHLVELALGRMVEKGADVVVLETEVVNKGALRLYEGKGFVRDVRLRKYYLNGGDAFRLKLWLTTVEDRRRREKEKRERERAKMKEKGGKEETTAIAVDELDTVQPVEDAFDDEGDDD